MADVSCVELERRKKRREFYSELEQYYRRKWNATLKVPCISGQPVDFFTLYQKVTSLGGWAKVSNWNRWRDVVDALNIPNGCAASEHAVKSIYMRYLAKYEQSQLCGETDGDSGDGPSSSLGGRSQRGRLYLSSLGAQAVASPRFASSVLPDYIQPRVPASISNVLDAPHCERLIRSLQSGLPNEVDFAINICLILSGPTKAGTAQVSLRLNEAPILLDLLLAHAGIFDQGVSSFRELYEDSWKEYNPGRNFDDFWLNCIEGDDEMVKLLLGDNFDRSTSFSGDFFGCLNLLPKDQKAIETRLDQIANILRNFSFESDCRAAMACSRTMIRYLLISINCRNVGLQSLALDTLSNIASEIILDEMDSSLLRLLMDTFSRCLHSEDKFHIIRTLETIGGLCINEQNETLLCEYLEPSIIRRMIALLAVKDIMMCVYLLECLYQMTEMGPVPCQRIAEQWKAIDILIQLVTVEAVSFGPNGLLGMKVIEYGMPTPHTAILPHPSKAMPVLPTQRPTISVDGTTAPHTSVRSVRPSSISSPAPALPAASSTAIQPPPPFLARPVRPVMLYSTPSVGPSSSSIRPNVASQPVLQKHLAQPSSVKKEFPTVKVTTDGLATNASAPAASSVQVAATSQQQHRGPAVAVNQDPHVEQLTMNWLRENCTIDPGSRVTRGELYASYIRDMGMRGSTAVLVSIFTKYVCQLFPSCVVRQLENTANGGGDSAPGPSRSGLMQFDGLKFRQKAMVKNDLISPSSSCSSTSPPLSNVVAQHPLMQQILLTGSSPEKSNSGISNASPVSAKAQSLTVGITQTIRARSNSAGTLDSGYSLPATPDSVSSGFSGTNSSAGVLGPTNFAGQQQGANSPRSPKKIGKKAVRNRSSTPVPATMNSDNGLVNGSVSNPGSVGSTTPSAVCHLEVCHPAQEARTVIETGDSHEARIVRVENTVALVSSQDYVPDNSALISAAQKPVNGSVAGGSSTHSDNSNGCDQTVGTSEALIRSGAMETASATASESALTANEKSQKKRAPKKKKADGEVASKLKKKKETVPASLNGLVKSFTGIDPDIVHNATNSSASSPSLDMEAVSQNVTQSVQVVNKVMAEVKVEKEDSTAEIAPAPVTPAKKTPKKLGQRKRKTTESTNAGTSVDEQPTDEKPPPKKKKYPKKKKVVEALSSPQKTLDDSFSQASTSSVQSSGAPSTPAAAAFRPPLLPTVSPSASVIQPTVITAPGANGQPVIIRIPPPGRLQYLCEWDGCGMKFSTANAVYYHVSKTHINEETRVCGWPNCDSTVRLRWSLVAHVQDAHCNETVLRTSALRRYELSVCGHTNIAESRPPPPHPGYPLDAAIVAIRRNSLLNLPKEVVDEHEGPVTKNIRLTSSLILRNMARYSIDGRRILRKHERILTYIAFSRLESSAALAQCLAELNCSSSPLKEQADNGESKSGS